MKYTSKKRSLYYSKPGLISLLISFLILSSCTAWPAFTAVVGLGGSSGSGGSMAGIALLVGEEPGDEAAEITRIEITASSYEVPVESEIQLQATAIYSNHTNSDITTEVTWFSTDAAKLELSANGRFAAHTIGEVEVEASYQGHTARRNVIIRNTYLTGIEINPKNSAINAGYSETFSVIGIYDNDTTADITGNAAVSFEVVNTGIAELTAPKGKVEGKTDGSTVVRAIYNGSSTFQDEANLTVNNAVLESITVSPETMTKALGLPAKFIATGHFSDGTSQDITDDVTWSSDDTDRAEPAAEAGEFTTRQTTDGSPVTITAEYAAHSATAELTIDQKLLTEIHISPESVSRPLGMVQQFTATGTFTDGSSEDVTDAVTWSSDDEDTVTIQNSGQPGRAISHSTGEVTINAEYGGTGGDPLVSATAAFTITAAELVSIAIVPANPSVMVGNTINLNAVGTYTDGSEMTITTEVIWSVDLISGNTVATASNADGSKGRVTPETSLATTQTTTVRAVKNGEEGTTTLTIEPDTVPPVVSTVSSIGPTEIRITFSKSVHAGRATNKHHYRIIDASSISGQCSDNSNFDDASGNVTADFNILTVTGSGSTYTLELSASQTFGKNYILIVDRNAIHDTTPSENYLGCPNQGSFEGQALLRVNSASCNDLQSVIVSFSKPVATGNPDIVPGSAECFSEAQCSGRYSLEGGSFGTIESVRILDGTVCDGAPADDSRVCIRHQNLQGGAIYTAIAPTSIRDVDDNENLQGNPRDRANFSGCGDVPNYFDEGPVSENTFGDGTTFGFLTDYAGQIYLGPNQFGNSASRFQYSATSPETIGFTFEKDSGHRNSATTRDGGIEVPPFVSLGHTGCTEDSADLSTGCGPDNENGRGTFVSGVLNGQDYMFLGGSRNFPGVTFPEFNYLYYTSNTGNTLAYKWIYLGNITGSSTAGTQSLQTFENRLYAGFAKLNEKSDGGSGVSRNTPDFGVVRFGTSETGSQCQAGSNCDAAGGRGERFRIDRVPYFGGSSADSNNNTYTNFGKYTGVDSLFIFNDRIYAANGGHHKRNHNGGIIRSAVENPGACDEKYDCEDNWLEITPRSHEHWHGTGVNENRWFSLELRRAFDFTPADHAFAAFTEYNGRLYATRTICVTDESTVASTAAGHDEAVNLPPRPGCNDGSFYNRRPQLWVCDPSESGDPDHCDSGDWSVVADDDGFGRTGITNFGNIENHSITMAQANGDYLYIGFDNENGIEVYRTNVANPGSSSSDWEQVSTAGFGDPGALQSIFSAISVQACCGMHFLYISVGKNGVPVRIYRQHNP